MANVTDGQQHTVPGKGNGTPLLEVTDLKKHFPVKKGILRRLGGRLAATGPCASFVPPPDRSPSPEPGRCV